MAEIDFPSSAAPGDVFTSLNPIVPPYYNHWVWDGYGWILATHHYFRVWDPASPNTGMLHFGSSGVGYIHHDLTTVSITGTGGIHAAGPVVTGSTGLWGVGATGVSSLWTHYIIGKQDGGDSTDDLYVQSGIAKNTYFGDGTVGAPSSVSILNGAFVTTSGTAGGISGPTSGTWAAKVVMNTDSATCHGLSVHSRWGLDASSIFEVATGWNGASAGYYPVFRIGGGSGLQKLAVDGSTVHFAVDGNGDGYLSGKLGIGATSAGSLLQLDSAKAQASNSTTGGIWIRNTTAAWDNATTFGMLSMRDQSNVTLGQIKSYKYSAGIWGFSFDGYSSGVVSDVFQIYGTGAGVISKGSVVIGSNGGPGGLWQAGAIYADTNWGMVFRTATNGPAAADYAWFRYDGSTELMRLTSTYLQLAGWLGVGVTPILDFNVLISGTAITSHDSAGTAIEGPNYTGPGGTLGLFCNDAAGAGQGGSLTLGTKYSGNSGAALGKIWARLESGTSFGGYMSFSTRNDGGNMTEYLRILHGGGLIQYITHGNNLRLYLPAANNGAGTGDASLFLWISEPGATWTGAGIARNIYNASGFPTANDALSSQWMHFAEDGKIYFYVRQGGSPNTQYTPMVLGPEGLYTYLLWGETQRVVYITNTATSTVAHFMLLGCYDYASATKYGASMILHGQSNTGGYEGSTGDFVINAKTAFGNTSLLGTAAGVLTWGNTYLVAASTGVGIGTSSTTYLYGAYGLTIKGSYPGLAFSGNEVGAKNWLLYEAGGLMRLYESVTASDLFLFSTTGLGIGGTASFPLDVVGNQNSAYVGARIYNSNTGASAASTLRLDNAGRYVNLNVVYSGQYLHENTSGILTKYQDYDTHYMRTQAGSTTIATFTSSGVTLTTALTVGSGLNASDIYMSDADEGARRIHCNSNRLGFLTSSDAWGVACEDDGTFGTVGTIEVASYGSGNRYAIVDFHGDDTNTDYALRVMRGNGGVNADSYISHKGTGALRLQAEDNGSIVLYWNSADRVYMSGTTIYPTTDNQIGLGANGQRWVDVWAVNGTIQTSDRNAKSNIVPILLGDEFVQALEPKSFRLLSDIRTRHGLIAQDVKALAERFGVDFGDVTEDGTGLNYAGFIGPLVAASQKQRSELDAQRAEIASLRAQLEDMRAGRTH